jgi:hypothetical protein
LRSDVVAGTGKPAIHIMKDVRPNRTMAISLLPLAAGVHLGGSNAPACGTQYEKRRGSNERHSGSTTPGEPNGERRHQPGREAEPYDSGLDAKPKQRRRGSAAD